MSNQNRSFKILVVDDNETIATMIQKYLKLKLNHDCMVSNSAKDALPLILGGEYEIILLDLAMPEYSGIDLINYLDANGKINQYKIIVFTAWSLTDKEENELIKKGVRSILEKPVKLDELLDVIRGVSEEKCLEH